MRKTLTDKGVAALKPRPQRFAYPDPELTGHYVRVQPSGAKAFATVARNPSGKQIWTSIGATDMMSISEAREQAREVIKRVRTGLPAFEAPPTKPDSFEDVAHQWLKRHAEVKQLRSLKNIERLLRVHVFSKWSDRAFLDIRRSDVTALLDAVEDGHGARQADLVLTVVRSIMNWQATRTDDYTPPVIRGMRRQNPKEHTRSRVLADDEIRAIWKQAEGNGRFGAIVRLALLTGQRRTKIAAMKWDHLSANGVWTIPLAAREKGNGGAIMLPPVALDIIKGQDRIGESPYVFPAGRGDGHLLGFSEMKRDFDADLPDVAPWVLHDLRRTARSLMSRAEVRPDIAELVLGHAVGGVQEIYDRHHYSDEKADALRRLAALIDGIVKPRGENVVAMSRRGKKITP